MRRGHVEDVRLPADPAAEEDVHLGVAERRRHLVLHDLHAGPHPLDLVTGLQVLDAADLHAHRGVELQRPAAGRGLGRVVDHNPIREIGVVAFHLEVETVHGSRPRLDVDPRDPRGYRAVMSPGREAGAVEVRVAEVRLPGVSTPQVGVELVLDGRMQVGRNQFVEPFRLFRRKPEAAAVISRCPHPDSLEERSRPGSSFSLKGFVVHNGLAVPRSFEMSSE